MYSNESTLTRSGKRIDEKDIYWSVVKGICVLCVIIIHLTMPEVSGKVPLSWWLVKRLVSFPVGMFFALAGYFIHLDQCTDVAYLWKKIKRILIPYLYFSALYLVRSSFEAPINAKGVLASVLLGTAEIQLYFCVYLLQMILLLPLLHKLVVCSKYRLCWLFLLIALSVVWSYLKSYLKVFPLVLNALCFPFLFFYALGLYLKALSEETAGKGKWICLIYRWRWVLVGGGCAVMLAEALPQRLTMQVSIGNYAYTTAIILTAFSVYWCRKPKLSTRFAHFLGYLGYNSFSVFLVHMFLLRVLYSLENTLSYPLLQIVEFTATLAGSLLVIWVIQKLFKGRKWLKTLGF